MIGLSDNKYTVREPMFKEEESFLKVPVIREGDLSETAVVTINTKDGSADAGKDYNGFFKGGCVRVVCLWRWRRRGGGGGGGVRKEGRGFSTSVSTSNQGRCLQVPLSSRT